MRPPSFLAALPLLAVSVSAAGGLIDNMKDFNAISSDADKFDGDYYVRNVKTGKYLYFDRSNDKTNLITGDDKNTIQLGQDKQYGQSGRKWETWHGTYLRGGNDKCMSAQWGEHGTDVAGVSYACKVGPGSTGSDSLETGKQFWKLVPCGGDGGSSDSAATADFKHLNVESKSDSSQGDNSGSSSSDASSSPSPSASSDNQPQATQPTAIDPKDRSTWVCHKDGKWLAEHPDYVYKGGKIECKDELEAYIKEHGKPDNNGIDPHDRSTWTCHKDAEWLAKYPDYVWKGGKIECRQRLLDYYSQHGKKKRSYTTSEARTLARRSAHRRHAAATANKERHEKRGSSTYCIIALDHLTDMATRAVTANTVQSFGGYLSVELANYNKSDQTQHWEVIPA